MGKPDIEAISAQMVLSVRAAIDRAVTPLVERVASLEAQLKALPAPQPGPKGDKGESIKGDPGKDADPEVVRAMIVKEVAALPPAKQGDPGRDADPIAMRAMVDEAVCESLGAAVSMLPKPKDGETGKPGKDGTSVHPDTIALMVRDAADKVAAALPKPKDGEPGFSLEDFDVSMAEDGRTLQFKFARGEVVRERKIQLAILQWRDTWREGEYQRGDCVTWAGSSWHCQKETNGKPGECNDWKMMVKKGAAGRDWNDPKAKSEHTIVRTA